MRILQLIDSLEAGGAERMAVNYANALSNKIQFSGLVATRSEGPLKIGIDENVKFLFLRKKGLVDFKAIYKMYKYCKGNKVEFLHAHSTSIFFAVIIKFWLPKIKIVWHDHYGNSEFLNARRSTALKFLIKFCSGAIAVNSKLENFIKNDLNFSKTIYLPNFASVNMKQIGYTKLRGPDGKRIVCLANLREQKNHLMLVKVAAKIRLLFPHWTFHFVGKDFYDETSAEIKRAIVENELENYVFLYGSCDDTVAILQQAEIAVLSSKSEGLPLAILEYGLLSKAIVATKVGEIPMIIEHGKNGYLVTSNDCNDFYKSLKKMLEGNDREKFGNILYEKIKEEYGEEKILSSYLDWIKTL